MPVSIICRGCGRRVKIPDTINLRKARCPKCRVKIEPPAATATEYLPALADEPVVEKVQTPWAHAPIAPKPVPPGAHAPGSPRAPEPVLSLDDDPEPVQPKPPAQSSPASRPGLAKNEAPPEPFRFAARVLADSGRQLRGTFAVVLTPVGLFLEAAPNRPILFAPVGTLAEAEGGVIVLTLPNRVVSLRLGGVGYLERLAADTAAFLAGQRPAPEPADYRHPWWLVGVGAGLGLALAAGPLALAELADLAFTQGLLLALAFAAVGMVVNAGIVLFTRFRVGSKVGLMAGACVALIALFFFGATAYLTWWKKHAEPPENVGGSVPANPGGNPPAPPPPPPEPENSRPLSHVELAWAHGKSRLDDGPADVTALAVAPTDGAIVAGYAGGETRVWAWDQAAFDPPRPGPKADGPVSRIEFDPTAAVLYLHCPGGLVAASRTNAPRAPVKIPGEPVAPFFEANRHRFAAVRGGRLLQRSIPTDLVRDPPFGRSKDGVVLTIPKEEAPQAGMKGDFNLPNPKPTFLAWHPTGKLLCGVPDGSIVTWPAAAPQPVPVTRVHQSPVRAWAGPPTELAFKAGLDFATGDDGGFVGVWHEKAMSPLRVKVTPAAVTQLAFDSTGSRLLVADAAGGLTLWDVALGEAVFRLKRLAPPKAVAFGPWDDIVLIADGRGVEVWWTTELGKQAKPDR